MEIPGGKIETRAGEIMLRVDERRDWARQFAQLVLLAEPDGTLIRLEDVARIYGRKIYNFAYRLTGNPDDAADLVQEVLLRVLRDAFRKHGFALGHDLLPAAHAAARGAAQALAQGGGDDVDAVHDIVLLVGAAAGGAGETGGVALVHHHHGPVLLGQITDIGQVGEMAVHGENAVGDDEAEAGITRFLQSALQRLHVGVAVDVTFGLAEAHAVDDRGVIELVGDDRRVLAQERPEDAAVGVEARGVEDRVLGADEIGQLPFEPGVQVGGDIQTDEFGNYTFDNLSAGDYTVVVTDTGNVLNGLYATEVEDPITLPANTDGRLGRPATV